LLELKNNEIERLDTQSTKRLRKLARKVISSEFSDDVVETAIKPLGLIGRSN